MAPHKRKRNRKLFGKPRDLYNDADTEQAEGLTSPDDEPMRDVLAGRQRKSTVERPAQAANRRRNDAGS